MSPYLLALPPQVILKRDKEPIRYNSKYDATRKRQYTWFFATVGEHPVSAPPALHPSCGLQRGDLFYHKHAHGHQLWLRQEDEATDEDHWTTVDIGYERNEDGRVLSITQKLQRPSWVGGDWAIKRVAAIERS
ncbi:hypothetical protein K466DRAFT_603217 [Polyporus arcularius HHB13444]|uniref:Uncharacterized protein n=1 Tax=Polyporus arcularius HHB13444 TaxID=1314778 RepID=A0A5C3P090_9APHY|nr:hypothetical protein K466DRAFT_603217 [Polyporus arcularius HHB13444]